MLLLPFVEDDGCDLRTLRWTDAGMKDKRGFADPLCEKIMPINFKM